MMRCFYCKLKLNRSIHDGMAVYSCQELDCAVNITYSGMRFTTGCNYYIPIIRGGRIGYIEGSLIYNYTIAFVYGIKVFHSEYQEILFDNDFDALVSKLIRDTCRCYSKLSTHQKQDWFQM